MFSFIFASKSFLKLPSPLVDVNVLLSLLNLQTDSCLTGEIGKVYE